MSREQKFSLIIKEADVIISYRISLMFELVMDLFANKIVDFLFQTPIDEMSIDDCRLHHISMICTFFFVTFTDQVTRMEESISIR